MIDKEKLMKLSVEELNDLIKQSQKMMQKKQFEILEKEKRLKELQKNG
mgnify:FL=1